MRMILCFVLICMIGCEAKTRQSVEITEENDTYWTIVNRKDTVKIKLKIYEHLPLRWQPKHKLVNIAPENEIFRGKHWIPGDCSYQIFRYDIDKGAEVLEFVSQDGQKSLRFLIGMRR